MSASAPPTWHWRDECYVPVETPELSIHSRKPPESDALSEQNDSPDPTYKGCLPSEEYRSHGPFYDGDQCPDCRCAPNMPHATGCGWPAHLTESAINAALEHVESCVSEGANEHPGWECDVSCSPVVSCDRKDDVTVESCPECGTVTDIEYEALMAEGYREMADAKTADIMSDTFDDNPLLNHMEYTFVACLAISVAKNADYASSSDPLANFRACQQFGVPLTKGIMVRLSDKFARIGNLLDNEAQVKDEAIADTIHDAIDYLAILKYALEVE